MNPLTIGTSVGRTLCGKFWWLGASSIASLACSGAPDRGGPPAEELIPTQAPGVQAASSVGEPSGGVTASGEDLRPAGISGRGVGARERVLRSLSRAGIHDMSTECGVPRGAPPKVSLLARIVPDGSWVSYTTLSGVNVQLRRFNGAHTALLVPQAVLDQIGIGRVRELVDAADLLYAIKAELRGGVPPGADKLLVAAIDEPCGGAGGCAWWNTRAIEVNDNYFGFDNIIDYFNHEMNHAFDMMSPHLFVDAGMSFSHAWTEILDIGTYLYLQRDGHVHLLRDDYPDPQNLGIPGLEELRYRRQEWLGPWEVYPGASWASCIGVQGCDPPTTWDANRFAMSTQSGMALRALELYGSVLPLKRLVNEARALVVARGYAQDRFQTGWNALSPEQRRDNFLEVLSRGVQANLSCFWDAWNWPVPTALRNTLSSLFGTSNPFCNDGDGDGVTPLRGDCNDANASIKPTGVETVNGVDQDCNGFVDDIRVAEPGDFPDDPFNGATLAVPSRVLGTGGAGDRDSFKINLASSSTVRFYLRHPGPSWSVLDLLKQDGSGSLDLLWLGWPDGDRDWDVTKVTLGPGQWNFSIYNGTGGNYDLVVQSEPARVLTPQDMWPITYTPVAGSTPASNQYQIPAPSVPSGLSGVSGLQVRHWVSGVGWIGTAASGSAFTWNAPSGTDPQEHAYRSEFVTANGPVWPMSQPQSLLPALPWANQDLGGAGAGSTKRWTDSFAVDALGTSLTGSSDSFRFTSVRITGNATIVARVVSLENTASSALAGVMVRENLNANARSAFVGAAPTDTLRFLRRTTVGSSPASTNATQTASAPRWLKLERASNTFRAYRSTDGASWTPIGSSQSITMGSTVYAGLAVMSGNTSNAATAQIDDVTVTGTLAP